MGMGCNAQLPGCEQSSLFVSERCPIPRSQRAACTSNTFQNVSVTWNQTVTSKTTWEQNFMPSVASPVFSMTVTSLGL